MDGEAFMNADEKKLAELNELIADEDRPGWQCELEDMRRCLMGQMGLLECSFCGKQVVTYVDERSILDMNCERCQDILDMTYLRQQLHFAKDVEELRKAADEVEEWFDMQLEIRDASE